MTGWYWVKIKGEPLGWNHSPKVWVQANDDGTYIEGRITIWDEDQLEILKGPISEHDIDIAYFGYWV